MSTRATYEFKSRDFQPAVTFYIHHDGYPEGAACYFRAMMAAAAPGSIEPRGGLAAAFLIGNCDLVTFHAGRDAQFDTEFHYIVDPAERTVIVQEREAATDFWRQAEPIPISDFIRIFRPEPRVI